VLSLFTKIDIGIKELLTTDGPRRRDFRDGQALDQVKTVAVESWLSTLKKGDGTALADGSKKRIRDLMHLLYEHAIRCEWTDRIPITSIRTRHSREHEPVGNKVRQCPSGEFH
jgi:hypothetical protein